MMQTPLDIDRVVREVIAELKRAPAAEETSSSGTAAAVASVEQVKGPLSMPPGKSELVISTRLVTMAEIDGRMAGICRVTVNPRAVVTPSARDALRRRNIALSRALPTAGATAKPLKLIVVAARTKMDPKLLASTLQSEGIDVQRHTTDCLLAAMDRLAGELAKSDALGLLLTPHTAAALCLANRLSGVRAVLGSDTGNVDADASAVGANLLVADPQNIGLFKLCRIAGEFFRGGIRSCPEVFRERLM